jgi:hypothetical protein
MAHTQGKDIANVADQGEHRIVSSEVTLFDTLKPRARLFKWESFIYNSN